MKLSKRMEMLVSMVPVKTVLCDVGCDHGYVAIDLVEKGICPKVYAMDLREGPLAAAKEHIEESGLSDRIETILSDGLTKLPEDAKPDGMLAAGMGGALIIKILEEGAEKLASMSYLLLQPQSEIPDVRAYLDENGYDICMEDMVCEDGKFYFAMLAKKNGEGSGSYEKLEKCFGEMWRQTDPARKNVSVIPKQISDTLDEMARDLGDLFGPALLASPHPLMPEYLQFVSAEKRKILASLSSTIDHEERKIEVAEDLEAIRLAGQIMEIAKKI